MSFTFINVGKTISGFLLLSRFWGYKGPLVRGSNNNSYEPNTTLTFGEAVVGHVYLIRTRYVELCKCPRWPTYAIPSDVSAKHWSYELNLAEALENVFW